MLVLSPTGYVPQDQPGAMSYFTPRSSVAQCKDAFELDSHTHHNPVVAQLHQSLKRDPTRHRRDSRMLHHQSTLSKVS